MTSTTSPNLSHRRVLVPGGAVGEGVVRRYLKMGANVVVPTRSQERADEFRRLGGAATDRLHLVVHDYTTFAGADALGAQMVQSLGGIDDVIAPIGGWWAGRRLAEIDEEDWSGAFVALASAHMGILRATVPRLSDDGTYTVIVGDSAEWPVPGSGLVSMEQSAVLMMQRVLSAEIQGRRRSFALVLGQVATRRDPGGGVRADQVGAVAVAASTAPAGVAGGEIRLHDQAEVDAALARLQGADPHREGAVLAVATMVAKDGHRAELIALLDETAQQIRSEPGCLSYTVHTSDDEHDQRLLVVQAFESLGAFEAHSAGMVGVIPRLSPLLASTPTPPELFHTVELNGDFQR